MKSLVALLLLLPTAVFAAETTCRRSPALTGRCHVVKGSLGLTPGLGVTLVGEDGARTLIKPPPGSNADIAPAVMQNWLYWQTRTGEMDTRISGAFDLCPLPTQPNSAGIADIGCINSGSHISVDKTN
jgi:hypothetical protein